MLKAQAEGKAATMDSPISVEKGKKVTFTATADPLFAVEKWTNGGSDITDAGANTTYEHRVTGAADIKVKFAYNGPALTLNTKSFTKDQGENFTYGLVTAGSDNYTATPEHPSIITLDTSDLNDTGKIKITCVKAGATRIKVTDNQSGEEKYSGTITVNPIIADFFEKDGVRYHVTDKDALKVSVTTYDGSNRTAYTGTSLTIPKEVTYDGVTYTVTDIDNPAPGELRYKASRSPMITTIFLPKTALSLTRIKPCSSTIREAKRTPRTPFPMV